MIEEVSRGFASDNNSGVHPEVMKALLHANKGHSIAYGNDDFTKQAIESFKNIFGKNIEVFFTFNGTAANVLALKSVTCSYNSIICAETAHIYVDECGAPEKYTGCKLLPLETSDGKLSVEKIKKHMHGFGFEHHAQPKVISITQPTEFGTVYSTQELKQITQYAHENNMIVHMDGARLSNAADSLNMSLCEITSDVDIDILCFGGTKNSLMFGEAIVFFYGDKKNYDHHNNKSVTNNYIKQILEHFKYIRKQAMQLHSKMRFISAQYQALLKDDLYLKNATHANKMAKLLEKKLINIPQVKITQKVESNVVFAIIPVKITKKLQEKYYFYIWNEQTNEVRWMTSFDTQESDIEEFCLYLNELISHRT